MDKYTWQDVGSSFLPGEIIAAFLWAQLEEAEAITRRRLAIWSRYHQALAPLEAKGLLRRPIIPANCQHNAHMYYVLLRPGTDRQAVLSERRSHGIGAVFHYVPLHSSPAGRRYGRVHGDLAMTNAVADSVLRLPFWIGVESHVDRVVEALSVALVA